MQFARWADEVLSTELPENIAAFHFNLYDASTAHDVEVVGCPAYDLTDADWACDDIFMSRRSRFEVPHETAGESWEQGLRASIEILEKYLASEASGAKRLRQSQAVSVGFVDGDLHLFWERSTPCSA